MRSAKRSVAGLAVLAVAGVLAAGWIPVAAATSRLAGNVWTIEPDSQRVTIIDAGRRISFTYDDETIIRRGSTDRSITDLRRGDRIVVSLDDGEQAHARLIAIAGPAVPARAFRFLP